jgi:hypothetical protein
MSLRPFLLLLCCCLFGPLQAATPPHAFHVSLIQADYNPETHALEIAVKIFTDDLEATLEAMGAPRLHLDSPKVHPEADALIARYLDNRLQWTLDGSPRTAKYLGKEYEDDATWCYMEITDLPAFHACTLHNMILTEYFEDQSNLVHITTAGHTQSLLLNAGKTTGSLNF